MAMIPYPAFFGGHYEGQSPTPLDRQVWNFFLEKNEGPGAEFPFAFMPTPGWELWTDTDDEPVRGMFLVDSKDGGALGFGAYAVIDSNLLIYTESGTGIPVGTVADTGYARFAYNTPAGNQILVAVDGNLYLATHGSLGVTDLTASVAGADFVGMMDGFFIVLDVDGQQIISSALFDGSTWPVGAFAQRSTSADPWLSMLVVGGHIWLFGSSNTEGWYNAGTSPFPFAIDKSAMWPVGIEARFSVVDLGGQFAWLARTRDGGRFVALSDGGFPKRISDAGLETWLHQWARAAETSLSVIDYLGTALGAAFQWLGHTFYLLTFPDIPNGGASWLYSLTTNTWTRVGTWNSAQSRFDAWAPIHHVFHPRIGHIFGSRTAGQFWRPVNPIVGDNTAAYGVLDTNSNPVRRVLRPPALRNLNHTMFFPRCELLLQTGVGDASAGEATPEVSLSYVKNGGINWSSPQSAGARDIGADDAFVRAYWTRLGSGRQWQPQFVFADAVPYRVAGCYINIQPGTEGR